MTLFVSTCAVVGVKVNPIAPKPDPEPVKFVVLGDMPYSDYEREQLQGDIKAAIAAANVPFLIHYGDFKAGNVSCTDEVFQQTKADMDSLHPMVMYTPGDNDWTDCDRKGLKEPVSELERLEFLRTLFFKGDRSQEVSRQADYPENARWWNNGVLFSTLHIVGTNNGRKQVLLDDPQEAIAQVNQRDQANSKWLAEAFAQADAKEAQAMVLVIQADVAETAGKAACSETASTDCDPYGEFRTQLQQAASDFRDNDASLKPILLVHGDTYPFCLDSSFGGDLAPNLQRLNAWGDFQQPADVTEIIFVPGQTQTPFQIQTLVNQVQPEECAQK